MFQCNFKYNEDSDSQKAAPTRTLSNAMRVCIDCVCAWPPFGAGVIFKEKEFDAEEEGSGGGTGGMFDLSSDALLGSRCTLAATAAFSSFTIWWADMLGYLQRFVDFRIRVANVSQNLLCGVHGPTRRCP